MSTNRRAAPPRARIDPTRAARLQRDAGMERGRSITKGIAFGSVAAVAVAGVYFSQALPGHTATSGTTSGTAGAVAPAGTPAAGSGAASTPGAGSSSGAAPAYTPAPVYNQAPVVSSGAS